MNYLTIKDTLKIWGVTDRMVVCLCLVGWIWEVKKLRNYGLSQLTLKNRLMDTTDESKERKIKK